jgi:hypothetical protein
MSTPAQLAANQANSQLSTGPVSPEGKALSSRNRLSHGFRSSTVLLPGDDPAEYEDLLTELSEHFAPRDLTETRLIREMADAEWRLRRVRRHMESAFTRHIATLAEANPSLNPDDAEALAVETLSGAGCSHATCSHATWLRYEIKFERQYDRANAAWCRYQDSLRRSEKKTNSTSAINEAIERALTFPKG